MKTATRSQSTYKAFVDQVKARKVQQALIKPYRVDYQLKPEFGSQQLYAHHANQQAALQALLNENQVMFEVQQSGGDVTSLAALLLSTGALVGAFAWLAKFAENHDGPGRGLGGLGRGVGKSKARLYSPRKSEKAGVTFADVAGIDESKQELQEVVDFLKNGEKYRKIGAKIPKGVLLVGPPGTGKTLLAKAIAGEAGVPFLSMAASEFVEVFVGVGASRVRDLFSKAKRQAPCIIFIDELDAIGKARGGGEYGGNDEREQTLNQLLTEMDGFEGNDGVILVAATNRPESLDKALLRPGRFDRQVVVDRPDRAGREAILRVHSKNVVLGEDVDLAAIATQTAGFAGADLANLVNEAALLGARNNRLAVLMADFAEAFERVVAGLEKRSRVLSEAERKTVAYHEVGHALVGALMPGGGKVSKISIVPRGLGALGYTMQMPEEDRFLLLEDELRGQIATLLGGRAAEEIVFGKVSTGASDDIQKATDLAERAVTQYGMGKSLGPIAFVKQQAQFLGNSSTRRSVSGEVATEIDRLVKDSIDNAYGMAREILSLNRDLLESTAQTLLAQEILEGDWLTQVLEQVQSPVGMSDWLAAG